MSDKPVRSVICGQHALLVTQNLFDFLTQMARNSHCGPFWIDAVCIDQSNDVEKNQQVNMMADIYQTAHEVLIWLGKADATTGMALKIITDFGDPRYGQPSFPTSLSWLGAKRSTEGPSLTGQIAVF